MASAPYTYWPNSTTFRYISMIRRLPQIVSIRTVYRKPRPPSSHRTGPATGRRSWPFRWPIVEPPLQPARPAAHSALIAFSMALKSKPWCWQKRWSSDATTASLKRRRNVGQAAPAVVHAVALNQALGHQDGHRRRQEAVDDDADRRPTTIGQHNDQQDQSPDEAPEAATRAPL